jgi:non-heme chloroperoxidase
MQKTEANPNGFPIEVIDQWRAAVLADRNQFMTEFRIPFYGFNRPGAKVSQGLLDSFLLQTMLTSLAATHDCIKAFAQTDFTEDLKKFDVPTLIMHGDDDQVVPIAISALVSSKLVKGATLKVYPGLPHGMCSTHKDLINADLLEFITKEQSSAQSA